MSTYFFNCKLHAVDWKPTIWVSFDMNFKVLTNLPPAEKEMKQFLLDDFDGMITSGRGEIDEEEWVEYHVSW